MSLVNHSKTRTVNWLAQNSWKLIVSHSQSQLHPVHPNANQPEGPAHTNAFQHNIFKGVCKQHWQTKCSRHTPTQWQERAHAHTHALSHTHNHECCLTGKSVHVYTLSWEADAHVPVGQTGDTLIGHFDWTEIKDMAVNNEPLVSKCNLKSEAGLHSKQVKVSVCPALLLKAAAVFYPGLQRLAR